MTFRHSGQIDSVHFGRPFASGLIRAPVKVVSGWIESPLNYFDGWAKVPEQTAFDNAFKRQWELFLRHVVKGEPFRWNLLEGAKGVQLAEKGMESWRKRAWVPVEELRAD